MAGNIGMGHLTQEEWAEEEGSLLYLTSTASGRRLSKRLQLKGTIARCQERLSKIVNDKGFF
jgi:hypothetical protein